MVKYSKIFLILFGVVVSLSFKDAQGQSSIGVSGYLTEMPSYTWKKESDDLWDNLIHNRIVLNYAQNAHANIRVEVRNRFFLGETVRNTPLYKIYLDSDPGWLDMSFNWGSSKNFVVNTIVDRMSYERIWGKLKLRIGRQRVDWSQSVVWNPNDIFNSYSYFDFDYPERPSMDGIRLQYDIGDSERLEAVVKMDGSAKATAALLFAFNKLDYDFQLMAGEINQDDYVLGAGWNGNVKNAGFYGEFSYLSSMNAQDKDIYLLTLGSDYTFKNALTFTGEYLYSSHLTSAFQDFAALSTSTLSVKSLSVSKHSYMLSLAYPMNSLLNVSLAYVGFSFPVLDSFYLSPSVDYSFNNRLFLSGVIQLYSHRYDGAHIGHMTTFIRLKKLF